MTTTNLYWYRATCLRVVDGDTLDLEIDLGLNVFKKERVRLARVNTPETYGVKKDSEEYKEGLRAKELVQDWLGEDGTTITKLLVNTIKDKTGKYGRLLAEVWTEGAEESINDQLIAEGWEY